MALAFGVQVALSLAALELRIVPSTAASLIALCVGYISAAMFAVSWHRVILLQEAPGHVPNGWHRLAALYFGRSLALVGGYTVLVVAVAIISARSLDAPFGMAIALTVGAGVLGIAGSLALGRLSLAFPAAAIDEARMTFAMSWKFTTHNSWRIFFAAALTVFPFSLIGALVQGLIMRPGMIPGVALVLSAMADALFLMLATAMAAGVASNAFAFFTGAEHAKTRPPASEFA
ncbi:MAG: hypothetical protein SGI91_17310 [Alphaproteobacteria bacterium]|nr:hypothetical protein [Alphaproteobacteria bacterium]